MTSKEDKTRRALERFNNAQKADARLWRYPLAEAVMRLFESGSAVTPESVTEQLRKGLGDEDPTLRQGPSEAAIERLRKFLVEVSDKDTED
jgi:hypothetical protein